MTELQELQVIVEAARKQVTLMGSVCQLEFREATKGKDLQRIRGKMLVIDRLIPILWPRGSK